MIFQKQIYISYFPTAVLPVKDTSFILGSLAMLTPMSVPPFKGYHIRTFIHPNMENIVEECLT